MKHHYTGLRVVTIKKTEHIKKVLEEYRELPNAGDNINPFLKMYSGEPRWWHR